MRLTRKYTDSLFIPNAQFTKCPYPKHFGRDRRILLTAYYENGSVEYFCCILHSCLEWRNVRVYAITHEEYVAIQNKYYPSKHSSFGEVGSLFDPTVSWRKGSPGFLTIQYELGRYYG